MSSLPGWACQYYSRNLPIPAFPWSACRVHLMSSLLGWACHYYSRNLPIPTFPWSACRVHLMSSLLGLPNSIQQFKCHTTLHMLSVLCVVLVYNFLGKLLYFVIKVSWKFLIAQKQLNVIGFSNSRFPSQNVKITKLMKYLQQFIIVLLYTEIGFG